jgi:hypothetical protein
MNPKKLKLNRSLVERLVARVGPGKHTLTWAKGFPAQVHVSGVARCVHVLENNGKRTEAQIERKLKTL